MVQAIDRLFITCVFTLDVNSFVTVSFISLRNLQHYNMSLFKKPKRNIRLRDSKDICSEETEDDKLNAVTGNTAKKEKKVSKSSAISQPLLSFDEDWNDGDDGEIFQVKKSSQSKKMRKLLDKERKKKKEPEKPAKEDVDQAGKGNKPLTADDIVITVKNTLPILNGREAEAAEVEGISSGDEDDKPGQHRFIKASNDVKTILQRGSIPDAATIHAVRKQRQHVREMGDFIPIAEETTRYEKENGSRLLREDDGSDGEEERIKMSIETGTEDRMRLRAEFTAAQELGSEDSEKGEEDEWEAQQIRKGVTGAQIAAVQQESLYYQHYIGGGVMMPAPPPPVISELGLQAASLHHPSTSPASNNFPSIPNSEPPSALNILTRMKNRLVEVREGERRHKNELDDSHREMASLGDDCDALRKAAPDLESKFHFYQELRGYVTDLVECLDEKIIVIEMLEDRVKSLDSQRIKECILRRRQDVQDQAQELPVMAASAGKPFVVREEAMKRRVAEREGRRIRRQRAREIKGVIGHTEGMSSDDETTEAELLNVKSSREVIESDANLVFEDTLEEFSTVDGILSRFEIWRDKDMHSYCEAYVSLCLPKILSPLIRLKVLFWNPLLSGSGDIEKAGWCRPVLLFSLKSAETEETLRKDPDAQLLPRIIDKIILPKIKELVKEGWDPISSSQTISLVALITRLIQEYPTLTDSSKSLNSLMETIVDKMKEALENDVYIPIYTKVRLQEGKVCNFFMRQCAVAVKLLGNLARWQGLMSDKVLGELALESLLNRYLLMAMRSCQPMQAATIVHMVGTVLPRVWLSSGLPQLSQFLGFARTLAFQLSSDKPLERDAIERMSNILKCSV